LQGIYYFHDRVGGFSNSAAYSQPLENASDSVVMEKEPGKECPNNIPEEE
jgi:hypothetical protein